MNPGGNRILLPDCKIRFYLNLPHPIHRHNIKLPDRLIELRGISCRRYYPSFGHLVRAKGLALQKLEHGRSQRFGDAIDLVDKENPLPQACLFHFLIDRSDDLAHGILCDRLFLPSKILFYNKGKADSALPGMMRDGIGYQGNAVLPGYLLHNLCLSDSRRAQKQQRPLVNGWDFVCSVGVF